MTLNPQFLTRRLSWIDKWNFAVFYVFNSCDIGFTIYFQTLWPALGNLSLGLLDFGLDDLARSMLRPKPNRAGRHGRRPTRRRRGREAIPELSDLARTHTYGTIVDPDRRLTDGVHNLWRFDSIAQKWTYRYSIIEIASDFWTDWWTGIIIDPRSQCDNIRRMERIAANATQSVNGRSPRGGDIVVYEHGLDSTPSTVILREGKYICAIGANAEQGGLFPGETTTRLEIWRGGGAGELDSYSSLKVTHERGETVEHIAVSYLIGPGPVQFRSLKIGETVEWNQILVWVFQVDN